MTVTITTTWRNDNPNTIWNRLAVRLGRQPTDAEATDEVRRILRDDPIQPAKRLAEGGQ